MTKKCRSCGEETTGSRCRKCYNAYQTKWRKEHPGCHRNSVLMAKHGIRQEDYLEKLSGQAGCCAICGRETPGRTSFDVDHDHATGKLRGLLCHQCNMMLGSARDSIAILASAIEYLGAYGKKEMDDGVPAE